MRYFRYMAFFVMVVCLVGCGTTNYLQWAKSGDDSRSDVEQARLYLDEGDYSKAKNLVKDDKSDEAQIVYAECLMGEAGVDLVEIVKALTDEKVSNNPVLRLEPLIVDGGNRAKILEAADIFAAHMPKKSSDKIIGALCNMTAHVGNLKNAFYGESFVALTPTLNSLTADVSENYRNLGPNPILYINNSVVLLGSLVEEDTVKSAIVSMNAEIVSINNFINTYSPPSIPGMVLKPIFGI